MKRYALISTESTSVETIGCYLPGNYRVINEVDILRDEHIRPGHYAIIQGEDNAGWTLDGYVLPRLASGLIHGREIDLSHPVMMLIEEES